MNINLAEILINLFDNTESQIELDNFTKEVLDYINGYYKFSKNRILDTEFNNSVKKFINDNSYKSHEALVEAVKEHFKDYHLSDKYIDLMIETRNE